MAKHVRNFVKSPKATVSHFRVSSLLLILLTLSLLLEEQNINNWLLKIWKGAFLHISLALENNADLRWTWFVGIFAISIVLFVKWGKALMPTFNSVLLNIVGIVYFGLASYQEHCSMFRWELCSLGVFLLLFQAYNWFEWHNRKVQGANSRNGFAIDLPVGADSVEKVDFDKNIKAYATRLIDRLFCTDLERTSFCIGITGNWGSGKTTFLNVIKKVIMQRQTGKYIFYDFNAWACHSPDALLDEFLKGLRQSLYTYNLSIWQDVRDYIRQINASSAGDLKSLTAFFHHHEGLATVKDRVNSALDRIGKSVIIFIDDIDRLEREELLAVLHLVRNTANFHHMVFILAYDKHYVVQKIKEEGDRYLEKIVNVEVNVPSAYKSQYLNCMYDEVMRMAEVDIRGSIMNEKVRRAINRRINNFRKAKKLANELSISLQDYIQNGKIVGINASDFILIELIRFMNYDVYRTLRDESYVALAVDDNSNMAVYQLNSEYELAHSDIADILNLLFPSKQIDNPLSVRIQRVDYYNDYFRYSLPAYSFTGAQFIQLISDKTKSGSDKVKDAIDLTNDDNIRLRVELIRRHFFKYRPKVWRSAEEAVCYLDALFNFIIAISDDAVSYQELFKRRNFNEDIREQLAIQTKALLSKIIQEAGLSDRKEIARILSVMYNKRNDESEDSFIITQNDGVELMIQNIIAYRNTTKEDIYLVFNKDSMFSNIFLASNVIDYTVETNLGIDEEYYICPLLNYLLQEVKKGKKQDYSDLTDKFSVKLDAFNNANIIDGMALNNSVRSYFKTASNYRAFLIEHSKFSEEEVDNYLRDNGIKDE